MSVPRATVAGMEPDPRIIPAELARGTVECLRGEHRGRPWITWWLLFGLAGAAGALPLVQVDVTVRGPGFVRPGTERAELKAAIGGRVVRLLARDNDRVEAGGRLVELDTRDLDERLTHNRDLQRERADVVADLSVLISAYGERDRAGPSRAVRGAVPGLRTAALAREDAGFLARCEAGRLTVAKARADLDRAVTLSEQGAMARRELDDARFAAERAEIEAMLLREQALAGWQSRLRDERCALAALASEERRLLGERALAVVRSPASGTVQGLAGLAEGSYVMPGQVLGQISPDDSPVVEVFVASRDIAFVRAGQSVRMQIDSFPYAQWGLLAGTVSSVADDAVTDGRQAAFKVVVRPATLELRRSDGKSGVVRKGMTLTARFVVARFSLAQLLYQDLTARLDPRGGPATS